MPTAAEHAGLTQTLATLLDLSRRARQARSEAELGFLLVNDTLSLVPYRQAALCQAGGRIQALSGLVQPEANAPYAQWLQGVCRHLSAEPLRVLTATDVPEPLSREWAEWWPAHALWVPLPPPEPSAVAAAGPAGAGGAAAAPHGHASTAAAPHAQVSNAGAATSAAAAHPAAAQPSMTVTKATPAMAALLLSRDAPWTEAELTLLQEWTGVWWHAVQALRRAQQRRFWQPWRRNTEGAGPARKPWWRRPVTLLAAAAVAASFIPVRLSVLAPGELVPINPVVVRAPLDGVVDVFHVKPNQSVKKGDPLFGFDEALIQSRLDVAAQSMNTAATEYRQIAQQALSDPKVRPQLTVLTGRIQEKRAEVAFLREQLTRARVLAPQDGVVLFDDPTEWIGKPVSVGERILRIAATGDVEVEAWLPIGDAIVLPTGAPVQLFLNASPLDPVAARLRYMAHDAAQRPDGSYAYRVRATLEAPTTHRVGLKGTAKAQGDWVPALYWVMRRPLATLRSTLGI